MKEVDLDLFEPFDELIEIEILGHCLEVPEKNTLLRALQYIAAESIAYGRFCWNDECGNCEVQCVAPETGEETVVRACQKVVYKGMKITSLSDDVLLDLD